MSEELYDIVFKGEIVKTFDVATAKQNVGKLFKMEGARLDALFSGKAVVLKRGLNFDTASKYRIAIKKAGAVVALVEQKAEQKVEKPTSATSNKAVFGERLSQSAAAPVAKAPVTEESADTSGITVAPAGSELIAAKDRPSVVPVKVDVSGISLKDTAGDLLDETEKRKFEARHVDISGYDLAPAGADVLTEAERPKVAAVHVDTSGLDIAEPGARLSEPSPTPPPAPDVSQITLVEGD